MAPPDQCRGDPGADDLLGVGVVRHDPDRAGATTTRSPGGARRNRTGQPDRAVFTGYFRRTSTSTAWSFPAVDARLQVFLRYARNGHGYCRWRPSTVSRRDLGRVGSFAARNLLARPLRGSRHASDGPQHRVVVVGQLDGQVGETRLKIRRRPVVVQLEVGELEPVRRRDHDNTVGRGDLPRALSLASTASATPVWGQCTCRCGRRGRMRRRARLPWPARRCRHSAATCGWLLYRDRVTDLEADACVVAALIGSKRQSFRYARYKGFAAAACATTMRGPGPSRPEPPSCRIRPEGAHVTQLPPGMMMTSGTSQSNCWTTRCPPSSGPPDGCVHRVAR